MASRGKSVTKQPANAVSGGNTLLVVVVGFIGIQLSVGYVYWSDEKPSIAVDFTDIPAPKVEHIVEESPLRIEDNSNSLKYPTKTWGLYDVGRFFSVRHTDPNSPIYQQQWADPSVPQYQDHIRDDVHGDDVHMKCLTTLQYTLSGGVKKKYDGKVMRSNGVSRQDVTKVHPEGYHEQTIIDRDVNITTEFVSLNNDEFDIFITGTRANSQKPRGTGIHDDGDSFLLYHIFDRVVSANKNHVIVLKNGIEYIASLDMLQSLPGRMHMSVSGTGPSTGGRQKYLENMKTVQKHISKPVLSIEEAEELAEQGKQEYIEQNISKQKLVPYDIPPITIPVSSSYTVVSSTRKAQEVIKTHVNTMIQRNREELTNLMQGVQERVRVLRAERKKQNLAGPSYAGYAQGEPTVVEFPRFVAHFNNQTECKDGKPTCKYILQQPLAFPFHVKLQLRRRVSSQVTSRTYNLRKADFLDKIEHSMHLYQHSTYTFVQPTLNLLVAGLGVHEGSSSMARQIASGVPASSTSDTRKTSLQIPIPSFQQYLFSFSPSRQCFPRGFSWDEGLHVETISKLFPEVGLKTLYSWSQLVHPSGWLPREQILGDISRDRVPEPFRRQTDEIGNPPTLIQALQTLQKEHVSTCEAIPSVMDSQMDREQLEHVFGSSLLTRTCVNTTTLHVIDETLRGFEKYMFYLQHSQGSGVVKSGVLTSIWDGVVQTSLEAGTVADTYAWRPRTRAHTLSSGLDDYPRYPYGPSPFLVDAHVDTIAWLLMASQNIYAMKAILQQHGIPQQNLTQVHEIYAQLRESLKTHHFDMHTKAFADFVQILPTFTLHKQVAAEALTDVVKRQVPYIPVSTIKQTPQNTVEGLMQSGKDFLTKVYLQDTSIYKPTEHMLQNYEKTNKLNQFKRQHSSTHNPQPNTKEYIHYLGYVAFAPLFTRVLRFQLEILENGMIRIPLVTPDMSLPVGRTVKPLHAAYTNVQKRRFAPVTFLHSDKHTTEIDMYAHSLSLMSSPDLLLDFGGLKSLAKMEPLHGSAEDYWRGSIWAPIVYYTYESLKAYELDIISILTKMTSRRSNRNPTDASYVDTNYAYLAKDDVVAKLTSLLDQTKKTKVILRKGYVDAIEATYVKKFYVYEQLDAVRAEGARCKPFAGWTAAAALMAYDQDKDVSSI